MYISEECDCQLLAVFADGKPHSWFEVVYLGVQHLKVHQYHFEKLLHRAVVDQGWLGRVGNATCIQDDKLQLTLKGDQYYRSMMQRRGGDTSYYKYFNRSQESSGFNYGLDRYAPLPTNLQRIDSNGPRQGS